MTERQTPNAKRRAASLAAERRRIGTDPSAGTMPDEASAPPATLEPRRLRNGADRLGAHRFGARRIGLASLPVPPGTPPMEAHLADALPDDPGWQFEPKWDGFRCLAYRAGPQVELQSKSGQSLARYFPDMVAALRNLPVSRFVLDGELVIRAGDVLSFDALQKRLSPAEGRVRQLAAQSPAMLMLFDCLVMNDGGTLLETPLSRRRAVLEHFFHTIGDQPELRLSPYTLEVAVARRWLDIAGGGLDGVVAKRVDGRYVPGGREMRKVKLRRSADCVVAGFRYRADARAVDSLLLGLYDKAGKLHHVGVTGTIGDAPPVDLTGRLEALAVLAPGAMPSLAGATPTGPLPGLGKWTAAWTPVAPELVVEVAYEQVTGDRFRHGARLLRWRPDKSPAQCTFDQLQREWSPAKLVTDVIAR